MLNLLNFEEIRYTRDEPEIDNNNSDLRVLIKKTPKNKQKPLKEKKNLSKINNDKNRDLRVEIKSKRKMKERLVKH